MNNSIKITIPGNPVPALRPRISGNRMYDLPKVSQHKKLVGWQSRRQFKGEALEEALYVVMRFYRNIPKSDTLKVKKLKEENKIQPIMKPDISNYVKLVEDGMNKIVYKDDSQIVDIRAMKFFSKNPRTEVEVFKYDGSKE